MKYEERHLMIETERKVCDGSPKLWERIEPCPLKYLTGRETPTRSVSKDLCWIVMLSAGSKVMSRT